MNPLSETLQQTTSGMTDAGVLLDFAAITLEEMDEVKMMNRFDSKFFLSKQMLQQVLEAVKSDYFILETAGTRIQSYDTIYFDTADDRFYLAHHNGRSNRMKLRKREYSDSGSVFLEIKKKNNKGITSKKRMAISGFGKELSDDESLFIKRNVNLNGDTLEAKFGSRFKRITLVSKTLDERCTIDLDLHFNSYSAGKSDLKDFAVAELKQEKQYARSKLAQVLKEYKIQRQPFSKYCFGRALNESDLKSNVFKAGIQQLRNQIK